MATAQLISREKNIAHLKVELSAEEVSDVFRQIYKEYAKSLKVPGFRKGHIPPGVIKSRIGDEQIGAIAIDQLKDIAAGAAMSQLQLTPRQGRAKWISEPDARDGEGASFEFTLPVLPEVKLPDYSKYELTVPVLDITESMKDRFKERLAERYTQYPEIDGPVTEGGALRIDLHTTYKDTGETSPLHVHGMVYVLGRDGNMPGWDEILLGKRAGEKVEFDYTMPENFADPRIAGKVLQVEINIESVNAVEAAALDEEFIQRELHLDNFEKFDDFITASLTHERDMQVKQMKIDLALQKVIDEVEAEITDDMLDSELDGLLKENDRTLREYGGSLDAYLKEKGQTLKEYRETLRAAALNRIKAFLVVKTVSEEENLGVTSEEFQRFVLSYMHSENLAQEDLKGLLSRQEFINDVHYQIIRHKAFEHVAEKVKFEHSGADEQSDDPGLPGGTDTPGLDVGETHAED